MSEQPNDILTQAGLILKYIEEHYPADQRHQEALRLTEKSPPGVREQLLKMLAFQEAAGATGTDDASSTTLFSFTAPSSFGPYQVIRFVQGGGGGVVYQVFDTRQGATARPENTYALKTLVVGSQEVHLRRFEEEVRSLRLQKASKYAPKFHDFGTEGLQPYVVMEFVEGQQFLDYASSQPTLQRKLQAFVTLCTAVQEMHTRGITHRDIKSGNVLVVPDGTPKILDYGIARRLRGDETHFVRHTQQGEHPGTLDYMSPEQLRPGHDIDNRTDIYSLGVLLYLTLSGRFPKPSNTDLSLNTPQVKRLSPEQLSECDAARLRTAAPHLSAELEAVCAKALATDADNRYETAQALGEDIDRYLSNEPVKAVPPSRTYYAKKFVRKNRTLVAMTSVAVMALLAGGVASTLSARAERRSAIEASAQAKRAEARFENVRRVANSLQSIDKAIESLPRSLEARRLLAATSAGYLDGISADPLATPAMKVEHAQAYYLLGDRYGRPNNPNLGDVSKAEAYYRRSIELATEAVQREPGVANGNRALVQSYIALGSLHEHQGDDVGSISAFDAALKAIDAMSTSEPEWNIRVSMAMVYLERSLSLGRRGCREEHDADVFAALHALGTHTAEEPPEASRLRSVAKNRFAGYVASVAGHEAAITVIKENLTDTTQRWAQNPTDRVLLRDLILTLEGLSRHYLGLKQPQEALLYSRQCVQLAEELVSLDPDDAEALEVLAVELEQVGYTHNMANQPTEALQVLEQCVGVFHRIATLSDDALIPWQNYAISNSNLAQSIEALGDRARAQEVLDRSIRVWASHREQFGDRADVIFNCARGSFFRSRFFIAQAREETQHDTRQTLLASARRDAQATRDVLDELKTKGLLKPGQVPLYGAIDGLEADCKQIAQSN